MSRPREGSRDTGKGIIVSIVPDVCKTPMGSALVPVPYSITSVQGDDAGTAATVRQTAQRSHTKASRTTCCTGDEPGTGKGVKSGTVGDICEPKTWSGTVRFEGKNAVRHDDIWWMNCKNTIGKLVWVEDPKPYEVTPNSILRPQPRPGEYQVAQAQPSVLSDAAPGRVPPAGTRGNTAPAPAPGAPPPNPAPGPAVPKPEGKVIDPGPDYWTKGQPSRPPTPQPRPPGGLKVGPAIAIPALLGEAAKIGEASRMERLAADLAEEGTLIDWGNPREVEALRDYSGRLGGTSFIERLSVSDEEEAEARASLEADLESARCPSEQPYAMTEANVRCTDKCGSISIAFSPITKDYDKDQLEKQLSEQEAELNRLTPKEFLDNRAKAQLPGGPAALRSTPAARKARETVWAQYRANPVKYQTNRLSALHKLDIVAGGYADRYERVGPQQENGIIGGLWAEGNGRYGGQRLRLLEAHAKKLLENKCPLMNANLYLE
jgi:hypothetical protein